MVMKLIIVMGWIRRKSSGDEDEGGVRCDEETMIFVSTISEDAYLLEGTYIGQDTGQL